MQRQKGENGSDKPRKMGKVVARFVSTPETRLYTGRGRDISVPPQIEKLVSSMSSDDQEGFRRGFERVKSANPYHVVDMLVAEYLQKSVEGLPQSSLDVPVHNCKTRLLISDETISALTGAGIMTVGDFVARTPEQLKDAGLAPEAIRETRETLLGWGIRTVDNPPRK
ncbi:hypothetical protein GF318_01630 [Candidatus Micrarchaeota archaeon]|nr:hypothetical protein [Candidatus Micrarchaeota archaeon]